MENGEWLGMTNIRHRIEGTAFMRRKLGYCVRYGEWEKGVGSKQLSPALVKAKELGIEKALTACDEDTRGFRAHFLKKTGRNLSGYGCFY